MIYRGRGDHQTWSSLDPFAAMPLWRPCRASIAEWRLGPRTWGQGRGTASGGNGAHDCRGLATLWSSSRRWVSSPRRVRRHRRVCTETSSRASSRGPPNGRRLGDGVIGSCDPGLVAIRSVVDLAGVGMTAVRGRAVGRDRVGRKPCRSGGLAEYWSPILRSRSCSCSRSMRD